MFSLCSKTFKDINPFEKRKAEAERIKAKFPDRILVIVERSQSEKVLPEIDKKKYLVPSDMTFGQFLYVIRSRLKLKAEFSMFLFINNTLVPLYERMVDIYEKYQEMDGIIYMTYRSEEVFG